MLIAQLSPEELREIIREEVKSAVSEAITTTELPPLLTRKELMQLLHIGETKTSELLGREDFPVFRQAGILIPTKALFEWIDKNIESVNINNNYLKSVI